MNFANNSPEIKSGDEIISARLRKVEEGVAALRMLEIVQASERQIAEANTASAAPTPELNPNDVRGLVAAEAPTVQNIFELRNGQTPPDVQDIQDYIRRIAS